LLDVQTIFDRLQTRCPRLGGEIPFDYCRKIAGGLPCSRALVCWERIFPVEEYMIRVLDGAEWEKAFNSQSKGRLESILEAAQRAGQIKPD